jgi:hypothetical protein
MRGGRRKEEKEREDSARRMTIALQAKRSLGIHIQAPGSRTGTHKVPGKRVPTHTHTHHEAHTGTRSHVPHTHSRANMTPPTCPLPHPRSLQLAQTDTHTPKHTHLLLELGDLALQPPWVLAFPVPALSQLCGQPLHLRVLGQPLGGKAGRGLVVLLPQHAQPLLPRLLLRLQPGGYFFQLALQGLELLTLLLFAPTPPPHTHTPHPKRRATEHQGLACSSRRWVDRQTHEGR